MHLAFKKKKKSANSEILPMTQLSGAVQPAHPGNY